MTVTATNLIQGPASLYYAAFGAAEPATLATALDEATWRDLGGTKDGVSLAINDTFSVLGVDQIVEEIGRVRTERVLTIKTAMAEATLDNLKVATNELVAEGESLNYEPSTGTSLFLPNYGAVILEGIAPAGKKRRVLLRKVLSTDSIETSYKKDGQTLIPVTFTAHWVSSTIKQFRIQDEAA